MQHTWKMDDLNLYHWTKGVAQQLHCPLGLSVDHNNSVIRVEQYTDKHRRLRLQITDFALSILSAERWLQEEETKNIIDCTRAIGQ